MKEAGLLRKIDFVACGIWEWLASKSNDRWWGCEASPAAAGPWWYDNATPGTGVLTDQKLHRGKLFLAAVAELAETYDLQDGVFCWFWVLDIRQIHPFTVIVDEYVREQSWTSWSWSAVGFMLDSSLQTFIGDEPDLQAVGSLIIPCYSELNSRAFTQLGATVDSRIFRALTTGGPVITRLRLSSNFLEFQAAYLKRNHKT
ncbi:hypothetical protein HPP92_028885 [Vanilla planifolia]|uniref:Uncharacterized protein n=1 Tax=Vanilla planifolia TaxID=51239 RepID=A0A835P995_VANPL|nr:hypothetical protein HPP92_028885 [Vanilla planifolia]